MDEKVKEAIHVLALSPYIDARSRDAAKTVCLEVHRLLSEKDKRIQELEADLKLNASMLSKQTDLAREAETKCMEMKKGISKTYSDDKFIKAKRHR